MCYLCLSEREKNAFFSLFQLRLKWAGKKGSKSAREREREPGGSGVICYATSHLLPSGGEWAIDPGLLNILAGLNSSRKTKAH